MLERGRLDAIGQMLLHQVMVDDGDAVKVGLGEGGWRAVLRLAPKDEYSDEQQDQHDRSNDDERLLVVLRVHGQ